MYLAHFITDSGEKPDTDKIKTILYYPLIKNVKDISAFICLAGIIEHSFQILVRFLLIKLRKNNVPFNWTSLLQNASETLKSALISELLLQRRL